MKQLLKFNNFLVEVNLKETEAGLVPLSFSVWFEGRCINGSISDEMYHKIEEGLIEHYKNNPDIH